MTGLVCVASAHKVEPIVGTLGHAISEELQAAQQRLLQLRAAFREATSGTGEQDALDFLPLPGNQSAEKRPSPTAINTLPQHLGWESAAFTKLASRSVVNANYQTSEPNEPAEPVQLTAVPATSSHFPKSTRVYPDVAIGLLQTEQVATGRLWLLLCVADTAGKGWLDEGEARRLFTGKRGALQFCGVRQLRNLLAQGENIFWVRQNGRIWLRSVVKVAFALEIPRLKLRPVALPVSILRQKIGMVRAHLYATFHSGRLRPNRSKNPIARSTIAQLTQVKPRTQRRYERQARVKRQQQFAIGGSATVENLQARGWEQGQATFQFKDFNGQQGQRGKSYVAWQLPNSYVGPHTQQPKGRQKRINQALTDLFMQGITGNGQRARRVPRRFFDNGRLAAKAYLRNPENDHYWRGLENGRFQLWQVMESSAVK